MFECTGVTLLLVDDVLGQLDLLWPFVCVRHGPGDTEGISGELT
jgi:hypothetical protein